MFNHGRAFFVAAFAFSTVASAQRDLVLESGNQRRALVIGNNAYTKGRLANAVNDARLMGATLRSLNFKVDLVTDAGSRQMEDAVNRFASSVSPGDVALFYYAGHGVQIDGGNYLIPVDFTGRDESDIRYGSRSASWVLDKIVRAGARLQIVVLDACRTDPFRTTRALSGGLAQMQRQPRELLHRLRHWGRQRGRRQSGCRQRAFYQPPGASSEPAGTFAR